MDLVGKKIEVSTMDYGKSVKVIGTIIKFFDGGLWVLLDNGRLCNYSRTDEIPYGFRVIDDEEESNA
jgi:hypothetical protein